MTFKNRRRYRGVGRRGYARERLVVAHASQ